jgi:hypothetical protein
LLRRAREAEIAGSITSWIASPGLKPPNKDFRQGFNSGTHPARSSLTFLGGDAPNAGYLYLEVKCLGCNTHQTVALNVVRRPKATPIHELERYTSEVRRYPYKRSHLVALRPNKISASDPASWWPGNGPARGNKLSNISN